MSDSLSQISSISWKRLLEEPMPQRSSPPKESCAVVPCLDRGWTRIWVDTCSSTALVCEIVGGRALSAVPFIGLAGGPLLLPHTFCQVRERIKVLKAAFKAKALSEIVFWTIRTVDAIETSLGRALRTALGICTAASVQSPILATSIFRVIVPSVMIGFSGLSLVADTWGLCKSVKALHEFKQESKEISSLFEKAISKSLDPPKEESDAFLKAEMFHLAYFRNAERREELAGLWHTWKGNVEKRHPEWIDALNGASRLLDENPLEDINLQKLKTIADDLSLRLEKDQNPDNKNLKEQYQQALSSWKEANAELQQFLNQVESELHRTLFHYSVCLFISLLFLAAGILLLTQPSAVPYVTGSLSLAGGVLEVALILFDKKFSRESFYQLERKLGLYPDNKKT